MHAAIRRYKAKPGSAREIARRGQEEFVPLVSKLPGFISYYGMAVGNDVVTISIFEDEAGEEESTKLAMEWVQQNLSELLDGPSEVIAGHVDWHSWG